VKRSRRSAAIASMGVSGVRFLNTVRGRRAVQQTRLALILKRRTHFEAVRSLTSAAAAASVSDQSSSTTRRHSRFFKLSARYREASSGVLLGLGGFDTTQPPRRPR
jgi:hypothetical protein